MRRRFALRWYWVVGGVCAALAGAAALTAAAVIGPVGNLLSVPYRSFYMPSGAMMPTLLKDDTIIAHMRHPGRLRRGMIVLIEVGDSIWIKRLAALPGDRVEFIDGEFFLNGQRVPRRLIGQFRTAGTDLPGPAQHFAERFPGERRPHQVIDTGPSMGDDFAAWIVPRGHVFVLGDNRDHSADSRYSRSEMGVGMLPISDIRGVARFIYWRADGGFGNWPLDD